MNPLSQPLADAFIRDFWAADHQIQWVAVEQEYALWLTPNTVLVGKKDAEGINASGERFFGDWKTGSKSKARYINDEKARWRLSMQALTYGLATEGAMFTVRWALKTDPPTTAFEWYTYTPDEIDWWRHQLIAAADEIRLLRGFDSAHPRAAAQGNWPLNLNHCTKYGERYRCAFRDEGCWKRNFNFVPESMLVRTTPHNALEAAIKADYKGDDLVVLGATRIDDFMSCRELYRREWEGDGMEENNESLTIGTEFHNLIAAHISGIMKTGAK